MRHFFCPNTAVFFSFLFLTLIHGPQAVGQRQPADHRIKVAEPPPRPWLAADPDSAVETRLVALALASPQYRISDHQNKIAEKQLAASHRAWLNLLSVSTNYNDQTFAKTQGATYVYPKYFFGITIPLGLIFSLGPQSKIARESLEMSRNTQEQLARQLKADVLGKYKSYKTLASLISLQNTVVDDEQAAMTQTEKKFKDGIMSIELYNAAYKTYSDDVAKKINLQLQLDLLKLDIEKMIGTRLENVLN
jgi:outer membrane protein TolC